MRRDVTGAYCVGGRLLCCFLTERRVGRGPVPPAIKLQQRGYSCDCRSDWLSSVTLDKRVAANSRQLGQAAKQMPVAM
jgi:hypothetical protein